MLGRKDQKVINVSGDEYNDLIKIIENMEGVSVKKKLQMEYKFLFVNRL